MGDKDARCIQSNGSIWNEHVQERDEFLKREVNLMNPNMLFLVEIRMRDRYPIDFPRRLSVLGKR